MPDLQRRYLHATGRKVHELPSGNARHGN